MLLRRIFRDGPALFRDQGEARANGAEEVLPVGDITDYEKGWLEKLILSSGVHRQGHRVREQGLGGSFLGLDVDLRVPLDCVKGT